TRLDELVRTNVIATTTTLTADLYDTLCLFNCFQNRTRIVHRVGHRLLDVRVTTRTNSFDSVKRMLKVGRCNEHGIDIVAGVEFFVVTCFRNLMSDEFTDSRSTFFSPPVPNIRNRHKVEVEFFRVHQERRNQRLTATVGVAHDADTYSIVCAENLRVARCLRGDDHTSGTESCRLHEIPT